MVCVIHVTASAQLAYTMVLLKCGMVLFCFLVFSTVKSCVASMYLVMIHDIVHDTLYYITYASQWTAHAGMPSTHLQPLDP